MTTLDDLKTLYYIKDVVHQIRLWCFGQIKKRCF